MSSPVLRVSVVIVARFFGRKSLIVDAEGAVLVVVVATVVDVVVEEVDDVEVDDEPDEDAAGVPLTAFDAAESPMELTALIVTEYAVPFVRPVMVKGLVVDAGESAV